MQNLCGYLFWSLIFYACEKSGQEFSHIERFKCVICFASIRSFSLNMCLRIYVFDTDEREHWIGRKIIENSISKKQQVKSFKYLALLKIIPQRYLFWHIFFLLCSVIEGQSGILMRKHVKKKLRKHQISLVIFASNCFTYSKFHNGSRANRTL